MRAKDKCPSCFQPVSPTDFLCASCELILDPSQAPERPSGDVSVVRRMLEAPQRGLPSGKPNPKPAKSSSRDGMEGPTRKLDLGPELSGVPVVVATLTGKPLQLSELEAWIVSLIDGLSDASALAKTAGLRDFELRVVLRTLHEKHIIDFADEPLSDADLEMPSVMGTLDEDEPEPAKPDYGANADRRDGRFAAPASRAEALAAEPSPPPPRAVIPPMPHPLPPTPRAGIPPLPEQLPPAPGRKGPLVRAGRAAPPPPPPEALEEEPSPIVRGKAEASPVRAESPPYPGATSEQRAGLPPSRSVGNAAVPQAAPRLPLVPPRPPERTDPRIAYSGQVNRKVLDALKKVKRADAPTSAPAPPKEEKEHLLADVLARDTLQVALRMEQGGRLDEAIRFLEKSISQSPDAPSLYNRLGIILMRERADYRRAEALIRKAIELAPENTVYSTNLQQVLSQHAMRGNRR
jgi:hypothetical protein